MTSAGTPPPVSDEELRTDIEEFLSRNFPQIRMHGGEVTVVSVDADEGRASIQLSGACSGCGISPMTVRAVGERLPKEIEGISCASVATTGDDTPSEPDDQVQADTDEEDRAEFSGRSLVDWFMRS